MFTSNTSTYERMMRCLLPGLFGCLTACMLGCGLKPQDAARAEQGNSAAAETREFAIEGMSCDGCVNTVTAALKSVPGVKSVEVSLKDKKATVLAAGVPSQVIEDTVSKAGFKAQLVAAVHSPLSNK